MNTKNIIYASVMCCLVSVIFVQCGSYDTFEQGLKYYAEGDTSKAIEIFKSISEGNSKDKLYAKNQLGLIYTDMHLYDLAISEFEEILSVDPTNNTAVHNNLGYAYSLNGENENAFKEFSKTLEIDPCNPFATIHYKYPISKEGIHINVPIFIGTRDELGDHLITKLDKPYYSTNELGVESPLHDYRDYAVWVLGKLRFKKAEEPLVLLLEKNDYDPCMKRIIVWALGEIRYK
jgi:tetratricopeptide (TPR) repeat protein